VMPENMTRNIKLLAPLTRPVSYIISEYGALLYRGAKRIIMPTESALKLFNTTRVEAPTIAISNGINLERFHPGKPKPEIFKKFKIPQDKPIISWIGRIDEEKHLDVLMRALATLKDSGYEFHGLFVGAGNARDGLDELVEDLGLEKHVT